MIMLADVFPMIVQRVTQLSRKLREAARNMFPNDRRYVSFARYKRVTVPCLVTYLARLIFPLSGDDKRVTCRIERGFTIHR